MFKKDVLTCSLKPILLLSKIFGLFPFTLKENEAEFDINFDPLWFIQTIFVFGIQMTAFVLPICLGARLTLVDEIWRLIMISGIGMNLFQHFFELLKHRKKIMLLEQFKNLDKKALRFGIFMYSETDKSKIRIFAILTLLFEALYCLLVTFLQLKFYKITEVNFYINIVLSLSQIFAYFYAIQLFIFAWLLKKRFYKLKNYLQASLMIKRIGWKTEKLHNFADLFTMSCEIIDSMNEIFSSNLLLTLLHVMIQKVLTCYEIIKNMYKPDGSFGLFNNLSWMISLVIVTFLICHSGESVRNAAESSQIFIVKQIVSSKNECYKDEIRNLHYQLEKQNKEIENIFFKLNYKLLLTVSEFIKKKNQHFYFK